MEEIWKDLLMDGYECAVPKEISNFGRIRKKNDPDMYYKVSSNDGHLHFCSRCYINGEVRGIKRMLSRLVAATFMGDQPENCKYLAHIDGDTKNCRVDNLCWVEYKPITQRNTRCHAHGKIEIEGYGVFKCFSTAVNSLTDQGLNISLSTTIGRIGRGITTLKIDGKLVRYRMLEVENHPANDWK